MSEIKSGVEKLLERDCRRCPILRNWLNAPNNQIKNASISIIFACEKPAKANLIIKEHPKVIRILYSKIPYCLTLLLNDEIPCEKLYIPNNTYYKIKLIEEKN